MLSKDLDKSKLKTWVKVLETIVLAIKSMGDLYVSPPVVQSLKQMVDERYKTIAKLHNNIMSGLKA